jgi:hypothetical protein
MVEEGSVDEIALVARAHGGLFIASPAPAILVEDHPALEQFWGSPTAVVHPERRLTAVSVARAISVTLRPGPRNDDCFRPSVRPPWRPPSSV